MKGMNSTTPASSPAARSAPLHAVPESADKRKVITLTRDEVPVACILSVKDVGAVFRTLEASRVTPAKR